MKNLNSILCLILLFLITHIAYAARGDLEQIYQGQDIDTMIVNFMKENNIPGMVLAIVEAPYIPRVVGYGLADINSKRLVSTNTIFNIGQITDAFTAVGIMQLVDAGMLKLDNPMKTYISNLPRAWQNITVRELISHSSGLPNYADAPSFDYNHSYTPDQIISLIQNKPLLFTPGTAVAASATDFYFLRMLIEKNSGMSYQEFIKKNQFERIPLKHTFFVSNVSDIKNEINNGSIPFKHTLFTKKAEYINPTELATGYTQVNNSLVVAKPISGGSTFADADIVSSAEDISIWDIGLAGDVFIKNKENRDFLYNTITLKNGKIIHANAGWQFPGFPKFMYIEGHVAGYSSFLSRFTAPKELVCVTLLANKGNVLGLEELGRKIAGSYNLRLGPPNKAVWIESKQSPFSDKETFDRFIAAVKEQNINVAKSQNNNGTYVLNLNAPSKATASLPFQVIVMKDQIGQVWLQFTNPVALAKKYGIQGQDEQLKQMYSALLKATRKTTTAY
jgi:CubicO group peptidase (beta-lactamase class C family)